MMADQLTSQDSMISVGERPWHGKGVVLERALSPLDSLKAAKLDWNVSTHPLKLEDGRFAISRPPKEGQEIKQVGEAAWKATVRDDTKQILGVVGPEYH